MANYNLEDSRRVEIIKEVANNIERELKAKDLAEVINHTGVESYKLPILAESPTCSVVAERGVIQASNFGTNSVSIPMKKYSVLVPMSKEGILYGEGVNEEVLKACSREISKKIDEDFLTLALEGATEQSKGTDRIDVALSKAMGKLEDNDLECTNVVLAKGEKVNVREVAQSNDNKDLVTVNNAFGCPIAYEGTNNLVLDKSQFRLVMSNEMDIKILEEGKVGTFDLGSQYMVAFRVVVFVGMAKIDNKACVKLTV